MAAEITDKQYQKLVSELKKNPGNSERHYAEASGIPQGQIASVLYKAELEADPKLKVPATAAGVVKAKKAGLRWPRVAAYASISVAQAKKLFAEGGGKEEDAYNGRGRKTFAGGSAAPRGASGRRSSGAKTKTVSSGTSGRRGAATKTASATSAPARGRRGTRASASDPK